MAEIVNGARVDKALAVARKFLPHLERSQLAGSAPGIGEGFWVGAPSAVAYDGYIYLAYRLRHPVELGRGQGVVIARSRDGVKFETITMIPKDAMDAESLERPTLVRVADDKWRLYLSCATVGTKHWRVEVLEASHPAELNAASRKVVLPGDDKWAVKDTVIVLANGLWHLWATLHPLDVPGQEDRMISKYATSHDGLGWTWAEGIALSPREGTWISAARASRPCILPMTSCSRFMMAVPAPPKIMKNEPAWPLAYRQTISLASVTSHSPSPRPAEPCATLTFCRLRTAATERITKSPPTTTRMNSAPNISANR